MSTKPFAGMCEGVKREEKQTEGVRPFENDFRDVPHPWKRGRIDGRCYQSCEEPYPKHS